VTAKLLFDDSLAARLARDLANECPGSERVLALGLAGATDERIRARSAANGYVLVTKDEDFHGLSVLLGPPPKVVWVRLGNCTTVRVAQLLRTRAPSCSIRRPRSSPWGDPAGSNAARRTSRVATALLLCTVKCPLGPRRAFP
jgi:predicted nuclease of predicted toxin-antitoxin system